MSTLRPAGTSTSTAAIRLHVTTLIAFITASSVPTPLYPLYQEAFGLTPFVLTVVFGVYPLALLVALLLFGALSDRTGRRPVILAALALEVVAMGLFLGAQGAGWLIAARVVQGFATGLATASLGAALIDADREVGALVNSVAPMAGLGIGALGSGLLARFAPAPLQLGFMLVLAVFLAQALRTRLAPETLTTPSARPFSLRPRIEVPRQVRSALLAVTPINVAIWALGGFYLSLMPSLIASIAGEAATWMGGAAVAALTMSGAAAVLLLRSWPQSRALHAGSLALVVGTLTVLAGVDLGRADLLLVGSAVAGVGFGGGFLGAVRTIMPLAKPHERAGLMAAFYIESYVAHVLPAIAAGYAVGAIGLVTTANVFGAAIILLAAAGGVRLLLRPVATA